MDVTGVLMNPNIFTGTLVGIVLVGVLGAGIWGLIFVLEIAVNIIKPLGPNVCAFIIGFPAIIFMCFLIGNGFLEYRHQNARSK
jgi:hypothetical protein